MYCRIVLASACFVFLGGSTYAQEDDNKMSSSFFGPNAMPVPDMLDGTVSKDVYVELAYDYYAGRYGDSTHDIFVTANIPVFSPRLNLSLWMPVIEFYRNTNRSLDHQHPTERKMSGCEFGNLYITTDIHILKQKKFIPDMTLRAGLITASGDSEQYGRYFDSPGYFFDTSVAKSWSLGETYASSIRFIANLGFLCWQVGKSTQNDAFMYGLKAKYDDTRFSASLAWQGYSGWINNGDKPMVVKAVFTYKYKHFRPLVAYQYGINDYPFQQFRVGVGYVF